MKGEIEGQHTYIFLYVFFIMGRKSMAAKGRDILFSPKNHNKKYI